MGLRSLLQGQLNCCRKNRRWNYEIASSQDVKLYFVNLAENEIWSVQEIVEDSNTLDSGRILVPNLDSKRKNFRKLKASDKLEGSSSIECVFMVSSQVRKQAYTMRGTVVRLQCIAVISVSVFFKLKDATDICCETLKIVTLSSLESNN
jgi:hypothetical protein